MNIDMTFSVLSENLSTKINAIITEAMHNGATLDVVEMSLIKVHNDVLMQRNRLYAGMMEQPTKKEIEFKDQKALKEFLEKSGVEVKEVDANGKDK